MAREPSKSDFSVHVPEIGRFTFAQRTRRESFRITAEYQRLTEGTNPSLESEFALTAEAYATVSVLLVEGPKGFEKLLDMDSVDPMDQSESKVVGVFLALRQKELSFRERQNETSEGGSQDDDQQHRVLVPEEIQPDAE